MKKLSLLLIAFMCLGLTMNAQEISEDLSFDKTQKYADLEMMREMQTKKELQKLPDLGMMHEMRYKQLKSSTKPKANPKVAMNETDKAALTALYNATGGANWTNNTNWLTGDGSDWFGITLDENGRVTEIELMQNNLIGTIPTEIGNLTNLTWFRLDNNQITGSIPIQIGDLTNLWVLTLSGNELTGVVPTAVSGLINLVYLFLNNNQFTSLPDLSALTNSSDTYIQNNKLDFGNLETSNITWTSYSPQANVTTFKNESGGNVTFMVSVGGTNNTYKWFKNDVEINGETANQLVVSSSSVGIYYCEIRNANYPDLVLTSNAEVLNTTLTHGIIPEDYDALVALYNLTAGADWTNNTNWLSSEDVSEWHGVTVNNYRVTELNLGGNNLIGTIPSLIGNLTNLTYLSLTRNFLIGTIPTQIENLTNLNILALGGNQLTGIIPVGIENLTTLTSLYLWRNQLTSLPKEMKLFLCLETNLQVCLIYLL